MSCWRKSMDRYEGSVGVCSSNRKVWKANGLVFFVAGSNTKCLRKSSAFKMVLFPDALAPYISRSLRMRSPFAVVCTYCSARCAVRPASKESYCFSFTGPKFSMLNLIITSPTFHQRYAFLSLILHFCSSSANFAL